ncbi:hypothetical protein TWF102_001921 [Orbilia oligospora]|uniref:Uncharacterized protein n=1 Tax=Orbilia oligospora TaxID=2813651 RepID=A0A7C8JPL3_ORBOL|nr:hypothetical protein TWF102_001921 [Orbilia oligospora]KAF3107306.1 hypothetical protein TWF706_003000 [Orbilia oligospora]
MKLQLWDLASGQSQILLTDESPTGFKVAADFEFSSDPKWLAIKRATGHLILWETNNVSGSPRTLEPSNVQEERRHEVAGGTPRSLSFSVDNDQLFYITGNATVEAWNLATGSRSRIYMDEGNRDFEIQALKPTPDGLHLALLILRRWEVTAIAALLTIIVLDIDALTTVGATTREIISSLSFSTGDPGYRRLIINDGARSMTVDVSESLQISKMPPGFLDLGWIVSNNSAVLQLPSELQSAGPFVGLAGAAFVFLLDNADPYFLEITDIAIRNLLAEHTRQKGYLSM